MDRRVVRRATNMLKTGSLGGGSRVQLLSSLLQLHSELPFRIFEGESSQLTFMKRGLEIKIKHYGLLNRQEDIFPEVCHIDNVVK